MSWCASPRPSRSPRIGLRMNPALDAATHPHLATGAAVAKFGIPLTALPAAVARLREAALPLAGMGAHIGSDIASADAHLSLIDRLADAEAIAVRARASCRSGSTSVAGSPLPDPEILARIGEEAGTRFGRHRLICEPGRSLVADAGWLVTRVVRVQPRVAEGLTYLVADAGMTDLHPPGPLRRRSSGCAGGPRGGPGRRAARGPGGSGLRGGRRPVTRPRSLALRRGAGAAAGGERCWRSGARAPTARRCP